MPALIALLAFAAIVVSLALGARSAAARRRSDLQSWAAAHSFSFDAGPIPADALGFAVPCLAAERRPVATNLMEGKWRGRRAFVLDVRGGVGAGSSRTASRLVVVTEGTLPPGAATDTAKEILGSIASALGGMASGVTVRTHVTVRVNGVVRSDVDRGGLGLIAQLAGATGAQVESGPGVTALVAPILVPAAKMEQLLDLAATLFDQPSAAAPPPADASAPPPVPAQP